MSNFVALRSRAVAGLTTLAAAALVGLVAAPASAGGPPVEQPFYEEITDVNPCSGELITLYFVGTAAIRSYGDHYTLRARGTVTTSDGYTGTFNRNYAFIGDRVETLRFHDMEVNSATGQRIVFAVGLIHVTRVRGEPVVDLVRISGARCVGPN